MRRFAYGALLACAALFTAAPALAADVTGVAFVHGTGHQTDAYNDYWQPTMVNNVRAGLANPSNYTVINCDFEQYMWDSRAAGCLATQLTSFINTKHITRLIIITHSNGGNVIRWIMSNPTWDSRYPAIISKIVRVDALAPSSAGTPLAGARLAIEAVPVRVFCPRCEAEAELADVQQFRCPRCGTPTAQVLAGRELELVALEYDEAAAPLGV